MNNNENKRVIVIGSGPAGLATAGFGCKAAIDVIKYLENKREKV